MDADDDDEDFLSENEEAAGDLITCLSSPAKANHGLIKRNS
jgi:hypothetical protein